MTFISKKASFVFVLHVLVVCICLCVVCSVDLERKHKLKKQGKPIFESVKESVDNRKRLRTFLKQGKTADKDAGKGIWSFSRNIVHGTSQTFPKSKNILHFSKGKEQSKHTSCYKKTSKKTQVSCPPIITNFKDSIKKFVSQNQLPKQPVEQKKKAVTQQFKVDKKVLEVPEEVFSQEVTISARSKYKDRLKVCENNIKNRRCTHKMFKYWTVEGNSCLFRLFRDLYIQGARYSIEESGGKIEKIHYKETPGGLSGEQHLNKIRKECTEMLKLVKEVKSEKNAKKAAKKAIWACEGMHMNTPDYVEEINPIGATDEWKYPRNCKNRCEVKGGTCKDPNTCNNGSP
eukprot:g5690.t1